MRKAAAGLPHSKLPGGGSRGRQLSRTPVHCLGFRVERGLGGCGGWRGVLDANCETCFGGCWLSRFDGWFFRRRRRKTNEPGTGRGQGGDGRSIRERGCRRAGRWITGRDDFLPVCYCKPKDRPPIRG